MAPERWIQWTGFRRWVIRCVFSLRGRVKSESRSHRLLSLSPSLREMFNPKYPLWQLAAKIAWIEMETYLPYTLPAKGPRFSFR